MANLKQCKCGKTISKYNGDLEKEMCFVCLEKDISEATKKRNLKEFMTNVKKKNKPRRIEKNLEKLAELGE